MMVDAFGGGNASQTASAVDDFYSSDAPQQQPVFCAGGPTTGSNVSTETAVQQTDADQLSPSPQAAQTRATVCLGGSPPSPSELSGTLDSHKVPGGAKFAVSQVHGVYLALHRLVLSRCAPWPEFFASSSFQRPGTGAAAVDRLERNLRYFSTNYICICCVLSLACALLNPALLGVAGLCGALCSYASFKGEVQIGETTIPKKSFQGGVCAGSVCLALLLAGSAVMMLLLLCTCVVSVHGALHKGVSYQKIAERNDNTNQSDLAV